VHRFQKLSVAALVALTLGAAPPASREQLATLVADRDFGGALRTVEEARVRTYGERDRVLYWLEKGALLHVGCQYRAGDASLAEAERRIEELYEKRLTEPGALLVNDVSQDYAGEPHERALLYVLRALNFTYQHEVDDAVSAARKATAFLGGDAGRTQMKTYRDDGLAHLLAALLLEDAGRYDDAQTSRAAAERAYARYARYYGLPIPTFGLGARAPEEGELVFLHYNGKVPLRGSREVPVAGGGKKKARAAVAVPASVAQPYAIRGSFVEVRGRRAQTVVVEPIGAITAKALEDELPAIQERAASRAKAKRGGPRAAQVAGAPDGVDMRGWTTLPDEIRMARLPLAAGVHDVRVAYRDARGAVVFEETLRGVEIAGGFRTYVHVRTAR
jgi:uncharacterized protein